MVAVAAPSARADLVRRFARERFGTAPVTVYQDPSGSAYRRLGPGYYPAHRFFDASGRRVDSLAGYPFSPD